MESSSANPEQGREPTLEDVHALAQVAAKEAHEAKTIAEAKANVESKVQEEASKQGIAVSDEDAKKIADTLITQLQAAGAFEEENSEASPPTPAATAAESSPPTATAEQPTAPATPAPASPPEQEPRKRTFAEKFMGR